MWRKIAGVLLVLVMLGGVMSPAMAVEYKLNDVGQRVIKDLQIRIVPTVTAVEDSKTVKNLASKMFIEANSLIIRAEKSTGCKLLPIYNKADIYYTTLKGVKVVVGKIPLKSDRPTLFIFAKNNLKTIAIVEIIDLKNNKAVYYIMDNKHQYTKTVSLPLKNIEGSKFRQITPLWISDPNPQTLGTHEIITYFSARSIGLSRDTAMMLATHSGDPDRYDSGINRYIKHAYDPVLNIGGAPDACNKNVTDAINSFRSGDTTNGYTHLAHALHYLEDVGNPYHTWLEPDGLFHNLINHVYYENLVYKQGASWNLHSICYYAQKHYVTSPKSAVKSLAEYSRSKAEILDLWVSIYRVTGWGYALDSIKGITQEVIEKTAGYVKGLIDFTIPS